MKKTITPFIRLQAVLLLFVFPLVLFAGCRKEKVQKETIRTVKTDIVTAYGENQTASFPGRVQASSEINLSFRISGPIARIRVHEGDFVRRGDVLAEMDVRDYEVQLAATEAEYKQVKAEVERITELYNRESVSENDYDKAVSGLKQITAKYEAHKNALTDTRLTAPFDAYVQKRYFDKNETVSAGMPILALISTESPEVVVNLPAGDFIRRDRFDTFTAAFDIYPGVEYPLELISVSRKANLNQLYTMRLRVKEKPGATMPSPGMSTMVNIHFKPEEGSQVSIPVNAMFEYKGQNAVWVYNAAEEKVHARHIRLFEIQPNGTVIVAEGLQPGEVVVSAGVHSLSDGQRVKRLPEPSETNVGGLL